MDAPRLAASFGYRLAQNTTAYSTSIEAKITQSPIYDHPVPIEPPYKAFDPLRTFQEDTERLIPVAPPPTDWSLRRIIHPNNETVDWKRAEASIAALAGITGPKSLELYATTTQAVFYLGAPTTTLPIVANAWLAADLNASTTSTTDPWDTLQPNDLVLVDAYSAAPYHRRIRTNPPSSPWRHILQLCPQLDDGDTLFAQILFAPARHHWHQNIAAILEAERLLGPRSPQGRTSDPKNPDEPIFAAAIRIGCTNPRLAPSIESFIGGFSADGKPFRYRTIKDYERVMDHASIIEMLRSRTTHTTGQLLTSSELAVFVHHIDRPSAGSTRVAFVQGLRVPGPLRRVGFLLGTNDERGEPVAVYQPHNQPNKSRWLIGAPRMGKSTTLSNHFLDLAHAGLGAGLLDPHRTTAYSLIKTLDVPPEQVVFLDFEDQRAVAYNPFAADDENMYGRLANDYTYSFAHLLQASGFQRMAHVLSMVLYALLVLKENLSTLPVILSPGGEALRRRVAANAKNDMVRTFWTDDYREYPKDAFTPLTNRFSPLLLDDTTRRTFTQHKNTINVGRIMDEGQLLIVALPRNHQAASLIGGMLLSQAQHAALKRAGTTRAKQHFHLAIDECFRFLASAHTIQTILDETPKGGLSVSLAHQETGQLPSELLKPLFGAPNIFVFGVNLLDAKALAPLFNGRVAPETLASQSTGECYARIDGNITSFRATPPPQHHNDALAQAIIAYSREHYYAQHENTPPRAQSRRRGRIISTIPNE